MLKSVNIDNLLGINTRYLENLVIFVKDPFDIRGDSDGLLEPDYDSIELILDKDMNPIYLDFKDKRFTSIEYYKEVLKDAKYYMLAKIENGDTLYFIYNIINIDESEKNPFTNEKVAVINLAGDARSRIQFKDIIDKNRLKMYYKEHSEILNMYLKVIQLAMLVRKYGKEYVAKDLNKLSYSKDSGYLGSILLVNSGELELEETGDIRLSKNGCILSEIVIMNDKIISMINQNDLYLTVKINKSDDTFILTYSDETGNYKPINVSIKDAIALERDYNIKNSLIKFAEIAKEEK